MNSGPLMARGAGRRASRACDRAGDCFSDSSDSDKLNSPFALHSLPLCSSSATVHDPESLDERVIRVQLPLTRSLALSKTPAMPNLEGLMAVITIGRLTRTRSFHISAASNAEQPLFWDVEIEV
jgi:hypothetical protein